MTSPSPASTLDSPPERFDPSLSPLQKSLLHFSTLPHAASLELMNTIAPSETNPRPAFSIMQDTALYWYTTNGQPLVIGFPAILDLNGMFGKTSPYFSLAPSIHNVC